MSKRMLETGTNELQAHVEDGVAVIAMNRPERRNALSGGMLSAMAAVLATCETDPEVACVVLTGTGGAFCAGGDVKGMADGSGGGSTAAAGSDLDSRIHATRCPNPPSLPYRARPRAPDCRWRWPATCGLPRRMR
jgi:enoyl-CoA hydratase/carnithine racemase